MLIHINDEETKKLFRQAAKEAVKVEVRDAIKEVTVEVISELAAPKVNEAFTAFVNNWSSTQLRQEYIKLLNIAISKPEFTRSLFAELLLDPRVNEKMVEVFTKSVAEFLPKAVIEMLTNAVSQMTPASNPNLQSELPNTPPQANAGISP
jgi:hypothetical protein